MSFIYSMTDTWNAIGTTFNSIYMNTSNGSSGAPVGAAASRALRLDANGTSIFDIDISGNVYAASKVGVGATTTVIGKINAFADTTQSVAGANGQFMVRGVTDPLERIIIGYDTTGLYAFIQPIRAGITYRNLALCSYGGVVKIGATGDIVRTGLEGNPRLDIFDGTIPSGTLANGCSVYSSGGSLFSMNAAGVSMSLTVSAPSANTSAATTITNGADSASNLGHRVQFNFNGTTYWMPCGVTAF